MKRTNEGTTHWDTCWSEHFDCALAKLVETNSRLVNAEALLRRVEGWVPAGAKLAEDLRAFLTDKP